ncbi:MAG: FMN-binding protein [Prevotellaceae bacterium]|nr:FMN-binding protein [Prevotellaceae bacterium]
MKKLESTWYNMAIVLTSIAIVAGAALGYVNYITAPTIKAIKVQQEKEAEQEVLKGQEGTAIKITDPKGFGGALTVMVGLASDGTILGYKVLESNETPGLGAKAQEWFQKGQKGDIIGKRAGTLTVSKDGGEVDAITASTITSRAFLRCINAAYETLSESISDGQSGATKQADEPNNNI